MAATFTVVGRGTATLPASLPAAYASLEVAFAGLVVATDVVLLTKVHTALQSKSDTLDNNFTVQVVKAAGKFTIYADRTETPSVKYDYIVVRES